MALIALALVLGSACAAAADRGEAAEGRPLPKDRWPWEYPEDTQLVPVPKGDPCYKKVEREIARIKNRYILLEPEFQAPPGEIKGEALEALFPNHRFFFYVWAEKVKEPLPPNSPPITGLAAGLHDSVAVDKKGNVARIGRASGSEAFGRFLGENRVKIANAHDAQAVWNAFCEIRRRPREGAIERVSDQVWRVGITKIVSDKAHVFTRYLEVHLKPDLSVKSARFWQQRPDGSRVGR